MLSGDTLPPARVPEAKSDTIGKLSRALGPGHPRPSGSERRSPFRACARADLVVQARVPSHEPGGLLF